MTRLLTINQTIKRVSVCRRTLDNWRANGSFVEEIKLPSGGVRFREVDIERWERRYTRKSAVKVPRQ